MSKLLFATTFSRTTEVLPFNIDEKFKLVPIGTPVEVTFCDKTIVLITVAVPLVVEDKTVVLAGIFACPVTT